MAESRLAIVIDSTGAEKNVRTLSDALAYLSTKGKLASEDLDSLGDTADEQAERLRRLIRQIDPVGAAFEKLSKQRKLLQDAFSKDLLREDDYKHFNSLLDKQQKSLAGIGTQLEKTGMSAAQTANAMRMVPAQFTDIVVSLASGQAPLTVLLQQGGQLKDMFGGIGPAIKGLGTYVTGIINPFTLAAAAVGTLGLAYYQGSKEQDEFYKSLTMTGNLLGKTTGQLADIAASVASTSNSTERAASSVLSSLVSAGKVAEGSLRNATAAILKTSDATGIATEQLVSDFNDIAADPVNAITKLNDKYHFLTLSTYEQIKALQDEGNSTEAARVATEAYSTTLQQRADSIKANLGTLEKAWDALGNKAAKAWDAMLNVGRTGTLEEQLADAERALENARKSQGLGNGMWNVYGVNYQGGDGAVQEAQKQVDNLKNQIATEGVLTSAISEHNKREQDAIKLQQEANKSGEMYTTNSERRAKAIQNEARFLQAGAITAEEYAKRVSRINEMYKDPAPRKEKGYTEDAGTRMLDQLRQQQQVLLSQADTGDKIGTQAQALIKWEQQLADIKSKQTLTADQKSLLANADIITAQLQQNAAIERQIQSREKLLALEKARADIARTIDNRQSQYGAEEFMASGDLSQYEQQQYTQRLSLEQSYNDKITQLRQSRASATSDIAREEIDQEIELQRQALDTELRNYDEHIARMNAARGSFSAGANRAWQEYVDSAANVSGMSQQLFTNAFSGMEDALVSFVVHGKASFRDFATSIISDLARIAARQALVGLGSSIFGSLFSAGASGATSASAGQSFAVPSFRPNAKGGVYDSPSLSSYSNGIYNSPQFFAFAKGAGVFGEAGPEAIMPLARGSNGSLGVRAIGASSSAPAINIGDINVEFNGEGQAADTSTQNTVAAAKQLQGIVLKTVTDWAKKEMSPGGVLYRQA